MIAREFILNHIHQAFESHRIVCLLGPRQCGKTTIAKHIKSVTRHTQDIAIHYFDLERPSDIQALETPELTLSPLRGLIVIDEIQRRPDLFPYLRYLHDQDYDQHFLILGSASRTLINQSSESLAGRIAYIEIAPFSLLEVQDLKHLWVSGGFPKSYLLDSKNSLTWRQNYMRTYIEQDLQEFGLQSEIVRKLWFMLAHYHGQTMNYSELATSLNVSQPTLSKYVHILADCFMIRLLKPWHANLKKRQVKSPKLYYRDSGLLHYVLGIQSYEDIFRHPKAGASFEGFAMEQVIQLHQADAESCYFWASHNKAELDLLLLQNGRKMGFEFKLSDAPKLTQSMRIVIDELELDSLTVIYPGDKIYKLSHEIDVMPLAQMPSFSSRMKSTNTSS